MAIVSSGEAIAADVYAQLIEAGIAASEERRGRYHFLASGDPEEFRRLGTRFLQLPIGSVEHVEVTHAREVGGVSDPRNDGRTPDELRPVAITPGFVRSATGSALIEAGGTRVICTATVEEEVPRWMAGRGRGWATAEYGMLPASTGERKRRDVSKGRPDGRTVEIQRLIGRCLRGVIDFAALGERTVWVDCDVLEADGGTRCAAITGGFVALELALRRVVAEGKLGGAPAERLGGGGVLRRGRRARAARPGLLGGLARRGGRQRRDDRRRWPGGGPGHGGAHAALARLARRAAGAGRRRDHPPASRPGGGGRPPVDGAPR